MSCTRKSERIQPRQTKFRVGQTDLVRNGGHVFAGVGLPCRVEFVLLQVREEEEELLQRFVKVVGHLKMK